MILQFDIVWHANHTSLRCARMYKLPVVRLILPNILLIENCLLTPPPPLRLGNAGSMAASAVVVQHQQAGAEEQSTGRAGRAKLLRQQQQAAAQLQVHGQRPDYAFGYVQSTSSCSPVQLPLCRISIVIALAFYTRSGVYRHSSFTSSAFTYKHPQPAEIRCHIRSNQIKLSPNITIVFFFLGIVHFLVSVSCPYHPPPTQQPIPFCPTQCAMHFYVPPAAAASRFFYFSCPAENDHDPDDAHHVVDDAATAESFPLLNPCPY